MRVHWRMDLVINLVGKTKKQTNRFENAERFVAGNLALTVAVRLRTRLAAERFELSQIVSHNQQETGRRAT